MKLLRTKVLCYALATSLAAFFSSAFINPATAQSAPDFIFEESHGHEDVGHTPYVVATSWNQTFSQEHYSGNPNLIDSGYVSGSVSGNSITFASSTRISGVLSSGVTVGPRYSASNRIKVWTRRKATVVLTASTSGTASGQNSVNAGSGYARYGGIPFNGTTITADFSGLGSISNSTPSPAEVTVRNPTVNCSTSSAGSKVFPDYPGESYYVVYDGSVGPFVTLDRPFTGYIDATGTTTISAVRGASLPIAQINGPLIGGSPVAEIPLSTQVTFSDTSYDPDSTATPQSDDICSRSWVITRPTGTNFTSTAKNINFTANNPGPHILTLTITDNEGDTAVFTKEFIVGGERSCTAGSSTLAPRGCSDDKTSLEIDPYCGRASLTSKDPTATRGHPLRNEIRLFSQTLPLPGRSTVMGNAVFTYGMQLLSITDPAFGGSVSDPRRILIAPNGNEYDYGIVSSGSAPKTAGVYPQLVSSSGGYTLTDAATPDEIHRAGHYQYEFDADGYLTSITDPHGNTQVVSYASIGKPSIITDTSSGKVITFGYDSSDRINLVTENGGFAKREITYNANSQVTSIITKDQSNTVIRALDITYDAQERMSTITRDNNPATTATITYVYGGAQRYLANISHITGTTNLDYFEAPLQPGPKYVTRAYNNKNSSTWYEYDAAGNITKVIMPPHFGILTSNVIVNHSYSYDSNRNVLSHSVGNTANSYSYNALGQLTHAQDLEGRFTTYTYAANNLDPIKIEDNAGIIAEFGYTDSALPHAVTVFSDGAGNDWVIARNSFGQPTTITPPTGAPAGAITFGYDESTSSPSYGWLQTITNGAGDIVNITGYTPLGDPTSIVTNPATGVTRTVGITYDATQRETLYTHGDGKTISTDYTGANATSTVDEAGTLMQYSYCVECGKLTGASGPLSWALSWILDADTDTTSFTDARSNTTSYTYGYARELKQLTYPDARNIRYHYDTAGRVKALTSGRGIRNEFIFNAAGEITDDDHYTYAYDSAGRLISATGYSSTVSYTYAANRQIATETYTYTGTGAPAPQVVSYSYNPDQTVSEISWRNGLAPGGTVVMSWTYGYDAAGRLISVLNSKNELTTFTYDGEGKLLEQINDNATRRVYTYNQQRSWPTTISHRYGASTVRAEYGLTYDTGANTVGNLTGVTESGSWVTTSGTGISYAYDALYRLTEEMRTGEGAYSGTTGYDLAGNITTVNGSTFGVYDTSNKITQVQSKTVTNDNDGNLTGVTTSPYKFSTLTWNQNYPARAVRVNRTTVGGSGYLDYRYLYDGKRYFAKPSTPANAEAVYAVYAGDLLIGELRNDRPDIAFTWGADGLISQRKFLTAVVIPFDSMESEEEPCSPPSSCQDVAEDGISRWYHFGPQGETRYLTDKNAALTDSYRYNSYGNPLFSSGSTYNPFRYGGKYGYYAEMSTGLVLATQRWYSPELRRWMSRDPIGYEGGVNLYEYVGSNPVRFVDPSGLAPDWNLVPQSQPGFLRAQNLIQFNQRVFKIAAHGNPNYILDDQSRRIYPSDLVNMILSYPILRQHLERSREIQLYSCETGVGGNKSFAQETARQLLQRGYRRTIVAPTSYIWFWDTKYLLAPRKTIFNMPDLSQRGRWREFNP